jgi:N,N-dimethylformamidase beta subunit-like, C-terminal
MKPKWNTSVTQSLLIGIYLAVMLVILMHFKFADSAEQKDAENNKNASIWSNDRSYLKLPNNLNPNTTNLTKQDFQDLQNLSYANPINLSRSLGHSQNPKIVADGAYVYALWMDDTYGNRDIYFRRSADNGITFGETMNLSDNPGGSLNPSMVASRSTSNLYIVWEHIPGNNGEIFFTRSTDNGETFESPINIGNNTGLNGFPQVALSENDTNVYVIWNDAQNGIKLRRSMDSGSSFETAIGLSDKKKDSQNPQIAVSQDNNVYVAWQSNPQAGNGEIEFTRSTDNGASFENPISLVKEDEGKQYNGAEANQKKDADREEQNILSFHPRIVTAPGSKDVYVVWHRGFNVFHLNYHLLTDILFSRSTDNGATFEDPISLTNHSVWVKNTDNGAPFVSPVSLDGYSGWLLDPQIAVSQDNNVYVAWQSNPQAGNGEIEFTRSTDNGASFENAVSISDKNGNSLDPQIAVSQDNNVYVAWQSNPQAGNGEIEFTRSTDNGASFENTVTISDKNGNSLDPQIAVSQVNDVYLVWDNNATGNEEIMLQKASPTNINMNSSSSIQQDTELQNITTKNVSTKNPKRIALVERTFTDAAYNSAFYLFYNIKHDKLSNITKYTNLLSSKGTKEYTILPEFEAIVAHLKWLTPQSNITLLTDADIHDTSSLFMANGTIKYDTILLGHNEYVSQLEYSNLRQYVANGGILILLDGNVLYAEVKYDEKNQTITLVKGHRWEFDGTSASKSVDERWASETTEWVGSNYCECYDVDIRFGNNPFGVRHNEEQYITNPDAKIILDYQAYNASKSKFLPRDFKIVTYELDYQKGKVITLGLYTDDLLFNNDKFKKFFDSLLYYYVFREQN